MASGMSLRGVSAVLGRPTRPLFTVAAASVVVGPAAAWRGKLRLSDEVEWLALQREGLAIFMVDLSMLGMSRRLGWKIIRRGTVR